MALSTNQNKAKQSTEMAKQTDELSGTKARYRKCARHESRSMKGKRETVKDKAIQRINGKSNQ